MKPQLTLLIGALTCATAFAQPQPDPQMQAVLDDYASFNPKPIETLTAKEARRERTFTFGVLKRAAKEGKLPEAVGDIDNTSIRLSDRTLKARIYTPRGQGPFPVVVYYHGGGWVIAGLMTYDSTCRAICNAANAIVVSVHYRQGPEFKFPAAHDDALDSYQWVLANASRFNGDSGRVAVMGESAGGNLAATVAVAAKRRGLPQPVHQALIYPVTQPSFDTPSYRENANAKPLNRAMMKWFSANYFNSPADGKDTRISLVKANVRGVAPATVVTAQIDPLRADGAMYVEHLRAAGVPVSYRNYPGVTHEFFGAGLVIDKARQAELYVAANLRAAFARAQNARPMERSLAAR